MEMTAFVETHLCEGSFAHMGCHSERGNSLTILDPGTVSHSSDATNYSESRILADPVFQFIGESAYLGMYFSVRNVHWRIINVPYKQQVHVPIFFVGGVGVHSPGLRLIRHPS